MKEKRTLIRHIIFGVMVLFIFFFLPAAIVWGDTSETIPIKEIDARIQAVLEKARIPGVSIIIIK